MRDLEVIEMLFHRYILVNDHRLRRKQKDFHHRTKRRKGKEIFLFVIVEYSDNLHCSKIVEMILFEFVDQSYRWDRFVFDYFRMLME